MSRPTAPERRSLSRPATIAESLSARHIGAHGGIWRCRGGSARALPSHGERAARGS